MKVNLKDIPDPTDRYEIGNLLGYGVYGKVYLAFDKQANKRKVAVKIQKIESDSKEFLEVEYKILKDYSNHMNIPDFYGIFKAGNEIWFAMELCDGGTAKDLVDGLLARNRRMAEEHIAYVIKETVKALIYLQKNRIVHRDVKASNILLTKEGEVKLCDFGLSKRKKTQEEFMEGSIGSPCWMAPELIEANPKAKRIIYDDRVDVWSVGITCIELGEGKAPFQDMHSSRILFQIAKNPPPTLQKLSHWSGNFHDFINECLVKDFQNRPYVMEIIEHPFLEQIPEKNYHLSLEIKSILMGIKEVDPMTRPQEINIHGKMLKKSIDTKMEPIFEEDLAALHDINENQVLEVVKHRVKSGDFYTFIGDILLSFNPNARLNIYGKEYHQKYHSKSRSDNPPHIYAIADTVYQDALHHNVPQKIVLSGETGSGKTTNYLHLLDHFCYVGESTTINPERILDSVKLIHSLIHATTPWNTYSTRAVFKTKLSYGRTGKLSGAEFKVHCLEKWRISSSDILQGNFQFMYYMYDGLVSREFHTRYKLNNTRKYRYLRTGLDPDSQEFDDQIKTNVKKFKKIIEFFEELDFTEEQMSTIFSIVGAILNLGEAKFKEKDNCAVLENKTAVENFAELLDINEKKISWSLTSYLVIKDRNAMKKRNSVTEARNIRNVLVDTLYSRMLDFIVNTINKKLSFGNAIFGAKYFIHILDYFGFECFKQNSYSQFLVNCFNEQMHYHYLQRVFAWEMQDLAKENIEYTPISYYDNKDTLNELLGKVDGVLSLIDDSSKKGFNARYITDNIQNEEKRKVTFCDETRFTVVHYTGKVTYNSKEMPEKNRDFLPPEIYETMRSSQNPIISMLFTNKLDQSGNLIMHIEETKRTRFNFAANKQSKDREYSQIKKMRTQAGIFRHLSLNILKELSTGSGSGGIHYVKCVRIDLKGKPNCFHNELVKQQVRAMGIVQTAKAKKFGYSQRISFPEFLRRYKFLAFDFDENVDMTRDNCRLLLIRLKMEGWVLGKSKVCLKYYNEEYLSKLYETQVRQIIKIQSILRGFLTKCRLKRGIKEPRKIEGGKNNKSFEDMTEDEAALVIQNAYRKVTKKKETFKNMDKEEIDFIRPYAIRWKNNSLFSVLLRYRAARAQDFFNFSQQVHFYAMNSFHNNQKLQEPITLREVNKRACVKSWIGELHPSVWKLSFKLNEIPYYDTSLMCDYFTNLGNVSDKDSWDAPYRWRDPLGQSKDDFDKKLTAPGDGLMNLEYSRDPDEPITELPNVEDQDHTEKKFNKDKLNKDVKVERSPSPILKPSPIPRSTTSPVIGKSNYLNELKSIYEQPKFQEMPLRKVDTSYRPKEIKKFNANSTPANKDFDYVKPSPSVTVKPRYEEVDPIAELRSIARRDSNASDDDPPFNFQGILRKTNSRRDSRDSLKNLFQASRRFSLKRNDSKESDILFNGVDDVRCVSLELMPGLIVEGIEEEL